jgi:AcrR family transcriptional regulator
LAVQSKRAASRTAKPQRSFTEVARRAQIVDEAIRTIEQLGYARASLSEIAQNLGISKGVISYHFANKAELVDEVLATAIRVASDCVNSYLAAAVTPSDRLRAYIQGHLAFFESHHAHAIALFEIYNARVVDYGPPSQQFLGGLEQLLVDGQRTGEFRQFSTRVMAVSIRSSIEAVPHLLRIEADLDLKHYAQELVETFDAATTSSSARRRQSTSARAKAKSA